MEVKNDVTGVCDSRAEVEGAAVSGGDVTGCEGRPALAVTVNKGQRSTEWAPRLGLCSISALLSIHRGTRAEAFIEGDEENTQGPQAALL